MVCKRHIRLEGDMKKAVIKVLAFVLLFGSLTLAAPSFQPRSIRISEPVGGANFVLCTGEGC